MSDVEINRKEQTDSNNREQDTPLNKTMNLLRGGDS